MRRRRGQRRGRRQRHSSTSKPCSWRRLGWRGQSPIKLLYQSRVKQMRSTKADTVFVGRGFREQRILSLAQKTCTAEPAAPEVTGVTQMTAAERLEKAGGGAAQDPNNVWLLFDAMKIVHIVKHANTQCSHTSHTPRISPGFQLVVSCMFSLQLARPCSA